MRNSLASIADRKFCEGVKYSDQQLRADRRAAHPDIVGFGRLLVWRMRRLNVPMFESTVWRTMDDQQAAYVLGHSKAKPGESPHNFGMAVDVIHGVRGWDLSRAQWSIIGHVGKELAAQRGLRLTWGGDWKFYDPAHWELHGWRHRLEATAEKERLALRGLLLPPT
ncbi:M15 family metallopeptidase [Mesorhizobium sp.]|uniref:M15 family metallopeptidase n=1 Tax=Mesorhizobium sp. TaxID=1871066 RepID=UPI0025C4BCA0|nr:M15 family metallopeptidase [Mesorhizobium sp.]